MLIRKPPDLHTRTKAITEAATVRATAGIQVPKLFVCNGRAIMAKQSQMTKGLLSEAPLKSFCSYCSPLIIHHNRQRLNYCSWQGKTAWLFDFPAPIEGPTVSTPAVGLKKAIIKGSAALLQVANQHHPAPPAS